MNNNLTKEDLAKVLYLQAKTLEEEQGANLNSTWKERINRVKANFEATDTDNTYQLDNFLERQSSIKIFSTLSPEAKAKLGNLMFGDSTADKEERKDREGFLKIGDHDIGKEAAGALDKGLEKLPNWIENPIRKLSDIANVGDNWAGTATGVAGAAMLGKTLTNLLNPKNFMQNLMHPGAAIGGLFKALFMTAMLMVVSSFVQKAVGMDGTNKSDYMANNNQGFDLTANNLPKQTQNEEAEIIPMT